MNMLLVGNGYDLHHSFPTWYINFINTIQFLIDNYDASFTTVGQVFGNHKLQEKDGFIKDCYDKHSEVYNRTCLPIAEMNDLISRIKDNMWFKYFSNSVAKEMKWIDFEKEIMRVLDAFSNFLDHEEAFQAAENQIFFDFSDFPNDVEDRYILSQFNFFFEEAQGSWVGYSRIMFIKPQYAVERIAGSTSYYIMKDDIASDLYKALREFANVLRDYLLYFVDNPSKEYVNMGITPRFGSLPRIDRIYSFNYTNTVEILYDNSIIYHIHGNTTTDIVLGINPDKNDFIETVDTKFLQFKKYFQRVFYKTDIEFIHHINDVRKLPYNNDINLYVMGHSLDSTDEDIIKQIFELAKSIRILYHNDTSVKNNIKNLVEIYGKDGFDRLRQEKDLQFLPQSQIYWNNAANK